MIPDFLPPPRLRPDSSSNRASFIFFLKAFRAFFSSSSVAMDISRRHSANRPRFPDSGLDLSSLAGLQADEQPLGVLAVELLEHVPGQEHAVDHPEALPVVAAGRVEVFVVGLEEPVVDPVGRRGWAPCRCRT